MVVPLHNYEHDNGLAIVKSDPAVVINVNSGYYALAEGKYMDMWIIVDTTGIFENGRFGPSLPQIRRRQGRRARHGPFEPTGSAAMAER